MYARDRSKNLMIAFNRISVCASYTFIRFLRQLLPAYAIMCSDESNVPIPSNINRKDFTMGGTDNSNYNDRSYLALRDDTMLQWSSFKQQLNSLTANP